MCERHLTQIVTSIESPARRQASSQSVQQLGTALLALLILAIVWLAATEVFVDLLIDTWTFGPRFL